MFCVAIPQKTSSPSSVLFQFSHDSASGRWLPSGAHCISGHVTSIVCSPSTHEFIPVLDHSRPISLDAAARPAAAHEVDSESGILSKSAFEAIFGGLVHAPFDSRVDGSVADTVVNGFHRG
jgi:hypothetical protein